MWCFAPGGIVAETTNIDPTNRFPADQEWIACPETVKQGWVLGGDGSFRAPPSVAGASNRIVSSQTFLALFTPSELAQTFTADPQLMAGAFKVIVQGTANLDSPETKMLLDLAVTKGALSQSEADRILAGSPPAATATTSGSSTAAQ